MHRSLTILAAATAALLAGGSANAPRPTGEQQALISAAVVYNIARFSSWPDDPGARFFEVCYTSETMGEAFATIAGKEVGGLPVRPVMVEGAGMPQRRCHVLFTEAKPDERVLSEAIARGTLTIGRSERFLRRGGAVRLRIDTKPRFSVNVAAAHAAGVRPSSKLLRLAEEVME